MLKKIVAFVKAHSLLLKLIFFGSVLVFVVNQFTGILHGMSLKELGETMKGIPTGKLILMFLCGLVGNFLLVSYDYVGQKALEKQGQSPFLLKEWLPLAFIINSLNNLLGFGGIIGATLRGNFYHKDLSKKKVLGTVSKMAFFMLTGLSIFSLVGFFMIMFLEVDTYFKQYWFWLLGGSFFAPGLLFFCYLKKETLFKEFFPYGTYQLVGASFLQWTGAFLTFTVIGYLLGVPFSFQELLPLFFATSLIGMLTMVPGGAGTFDVLMILGLGQMGISKETALLWLLFYRLCYYIFPFLIGGGMFIHRTGVRVNRFFDGLPNIFRQKTAHIILTGAMYFAGIMMVLLSSVKNLSNVSSLFSLLLPFSFDLLDQTLNMLVGLLLLGLSRGVSSKVQKAYLPSLILLIFCILNTIVRTYNWQLILVYVIILGAVYLSRKEFYREKLVYSFGALVFDIFLFLSVIILYAVAGFYSQRDNGSSIISGHFILFPSATVWLKGLVGLGLAIIVVLTLMAYLMQGAELGFPEDKELSFEEFKKFGLKKEREDYKKDKVFGYYYTVKGENLLYFNFVRKANKLFVFGDPLGEEKYFAKGIIRFMKDADDLGYQLAFYRVSPSFVALLHDLGFDYLKIGEEGYVKPEKINSEEEFLASDISYEPFFMETFEELRKLPSEFSLQVKLGDEGILQKEKGIITGIVLDEKNNKENAYVFLKALGNNERALISGYLTYRKKHQQVVDLGFFPLVNVGNTRFSFASERLVRAINEYALPNSPFNQKGKKKMAQANYLENRYLAYRKNANSLVALGQLYFLLRQPKDKKMIPQTILASDMEEKI